ncbi:hypothetical protein E4U42_002531 [Claviceps africana]|uniref:Fucose-specific lectin n=1 Tax=Claviceps africana TaxID=83212 RepID=A0A8K0NJP2_9HYPO|nr:hypothetical protein E4U42_002531 [Claviceps africana]
MSLHDIPWLSHQTGRTDMTEGSIPLEAIPPPPPPPPEYRKTQRDGPDAVHNHYHIGHERGPTPWYRRKWAFWSLIGLVVFVVAAGLITMGVVLKVELGKKAAAASDARPQASSIRTSALPTLSDASDDNDGRIPTETGSGKKPGPASTRTASGHGATATPFTMLDKSQLASAFVRARDATLSRRLLIRQDDTNDLLATEWANGQVTHYRIRDRLGSLPPEAKPGTPLALQADDAGTLHLFYLSRSNILSYVYEPTAGTWKASEVSNEHGSVRTSAYSSLSTAWHNGRRAPRLLVVAFDDASQKLRLAMSGSPAERGSWYVAGVTSVSRDSVPGQSNLPCYSLAGDWYAGPAAGSPHNGDDGNGNQHLVMAVAGGSEVHAWECAVDFWPPPDVQVQCKEADEHFRDGAGKLLTLVPPPTQFAWISLHDDGQPDASSTTHDFLLLSQDGSGTVRESSVGRDIGRKAGAGFTARTGIRALSATSEGIVFASSGKDVFVYSRHGARWQPDVGTNVTF